MVSLKFVLQITLIQSICYIVGKGMATRRCYFLGKGIEEYKYLNRRLCGYDS